MKKLLGGMTLSLLMVSCAPTVAGTQAGVPVVMISNQTPLKLKAGQTVYATYKFNRGEVQVSDERFNTLGISWSSRTMTGDIPSTEIPADWIRLVNASLPDGISVDLAKAFLVKDVVNSKFTSADISVNYYERVRLVLKFTAAPSAAKGPSLARLTLSSDGQLSSIPVRLEVTE